VEESTEPGAVMRAVAARNGVCESLLYAWRRQLRDGTLRESGTPAFVPVRVFGCHAVAWSEKAVIGNSVGCDCR